MSNIDRYARTIWDYHHVHHALEPAECILVLGSHDTRVAERAAELFHAGWAPLVVFSGNLGALTRGLWDRPEAEIFADVAAAAGVPRERMLIEDRSTNTGENVDFSRELLARHGLRPQKAIAVQKPYMMGDLQRLMLYAEKGWSAAQEVPSEVRDAYEGLIAAGYTRRLVPDG